MSILLILSMLIAVFLLIVIAACILAPELADHEACQPAPPTDAEADQMYELLKETQHIDTYA